MNSRKGFTLMEIMVVAVIIGMLASIAIPGFTASRRSSIAATAAGDITSFADEFALYNLREGIWPADGLPSTIPNGMEQLENGLWQTRTAIGGQWDWDFESSGFTAGVSIRGFTVTDETVQRIDELIDDGNTSTGALVRMGADHLAYILQE